MAKLSEIPRRTDWGNYNCSVPLHRLEHTLEYYDNDYGIDLDPDFQRGHVWSQDQQVAYMDFVLTGGHSSRDILFNCTSWNRYVDKEDKIVLVDGKQRIEACRAFLRDEFTINGHFFSEFTDKAWLNSNAFLTFHINNLRTKAEVLTWYLQLNTGGVVHTQEEIEKVRELLAQQ